jgi:hypothetical protein
MQKPTPLYTIPDFSLFGKISIPSRCNKFIFLKALKLSMPSQL